MTGHICHAERMDECSQLIEMQSPCRRHDEFSSRQVDKATQAMQQHCIQLGLAMQSVQDSIHVQEDHPASMEGGGHHQGGGYGNYGVGGGSQGRSGTSNDDDWKSRIVSNGQWLGEKVMALASRSHNTIPDNQRAMNDGRANWMAEIRNNARPANNSSNFSNGSSGYNAGGYQNDFATERPGQYSDTSYRPTSTYSDKPTSSSGQTSAYTSKQQSGKSKASSNNKKYKSKSSRRAATSSSEEDESEEESSEDSDVKKKSTKVRSKVTKKPEIVVSSNDDSDDSDHAAKSKRSTKKGSKGSSSKKKAHLSDSDISTESAPEDKKAKKKPAKAPKKAYAYALDASKLAAVAAPSTDQDAKKGKKKAGKKDKTGAAAPALVDLLGVESLPPAPPNAAAVFETPLSTIDRTPFVNIYHEINIWRLELAGLSFDPLDGASQAPAYPQDQFSAPPQQPFQQPSQQFLGNQQQFQGHQHQYQPQQHQTFHPQQHQQFAAQQPFQPAGFVVPGSNLVDLRLSSEVSAAAKANAAPTDTRSLDQLKASSGPVQVQPPPQMMMHHSHAPYQQPLGHHPSFVHQPMLHQASPPAMMAPAIAFGGVQYQQPQPLHHPRRAPPGLASPGFL
ncbi:hypothetical protein DYB34_001616 [Aphanomyces astaci]|uniref:Uncharacterized protein n=2 Tax=Aphanomyces astaci TaxID=112090 RepID=A0A3R6WFS9_APHAT|nr:hypothetical protein DYB34_001616 [Aphanomyces astaci]